MGRNLHWSIILAKCPPSANAVQAISSSVVSNEVRPEAGKAPASGRTIFEAFSGDFEVIAFVLAGNKNQSHGPMTLVGPRSRRGSNLFGTREASADQDHAYNGTVVTMPSPGRRRCDLAPGPCLAMTAMWQRSAPNVMPPYSQLRRNS